MKLSRPLGLILLCLVSVFGCQNPTTETPTKFTIVFNANGSSGNTPPQSLSSGSTAALTANSFTKVGFVFGGWNTLADGTGTGYADKANFTMGTTSVTLYAQWSAAQETITFDPNGGDGSMAPQTMSTGSTAALTANLFTRAGFVFAGWNTLADGTGTGYADKASFTMGTTNVTFYARWSVASGAITFNANGGIGNTAPQSLSSGSTAPLTTNSFTRAGFLFVGWNTLSDGTGTGYADKANFTMGTTSVTLYAQWSAAQETITFDPNGGDGSMAPQTMSTGSTAALTANLFTRAGFVFAGWNTLADGAGTGYADKASFTMGTTNVTFYARWAQAYQVTYDANGGGGVPPSDGNGYSTGATVNVLGPGTMKNTGFTFAGWTTNSTAMGPSSSFATGASFPMGSANLTLYAVWLPATANFYSAGSTISLYGFNTYISGGFSIPPGVTNFSLLSGTVPSLTSITIPSSVTSIAGMSGQPLTSLTLPATVTRIGDGVNAEFQNCTSLTSLTLSQGLASIDDNAFAGCTSLASVTIPSNITSIGRNAFSGCTSLNSLTISQGVKSIGSGAFSFSNSLTNVSIPASVTSIGDGAFKNCPSLTKLIVDESNTTYKSLSGFIYSKDGLTIVGAPSGFSGSFTIPSGVTGVGPSAFDSCNGLTSLIVPSSVGVIGRYAFSSTGIKSVAFDEGLVFIDSYAFSSCPLTSLTLPATLGDIRALAFSGCPLSSITMKGATPPRIVQNTFNTTVTGFQVHVPSADAVTAYSNAAGWSSFTDKIVSP